MEGKGEYCSGWSLGNDRRRIGSVEIGLRTRMREQRGNGWSWDADLEVRRIDSFYKALKTAWRWLTVREWAV